MQDIYDQISDEDEEESKEVQSDNPFKKQMIQEAKELKEKKDNELLDPKMLQRKQNVEEIKASAQKVKTAFRGFFE